MLQPGSGGRAASCRAFHLYIDGMGAAQVSKDNVSDTCHALCLAEKLVRLSTAFSQKKPKQPKQTHSSMELTFLALPVLSAWQLGLARRETGCRETRRRTARSSPTPFPLQKHILLRNMVNFSIKEGN